MFCIANWKRELSTEEQVALALAYAELKVPEGVEAWVLPRAEARSEVSSILANTNWRVGAQSWELGVSGLVLIGHASARMAGETAQERREACREAQVAGVRVVLCVGEGRGANREAVLKEQLSELATSVGPDTLIAYEPLWAIGSGESLHGDALNQAISEIKNRAGSALFPSREVLYGGSVDATVVREIAQSGVVGLLVGTASWKMETWVPLVEAVKLC